MRILVNDLAASASGAMSVLKSFYQYVRENDNENEYIFLLREYDVKIYAENIESAEKKQYQGGRKKSFCGFRQASLFHF